MFGKQFNYDYIEEKLSQFVELSFKPTKDDLPLEIKRQLDFLASQRNGSHQKQGKEPEACGHEGVANEHLLSVHPHGV